MNYKIAVIPGDGIGPEIMNEALKVLDKIGEKYGHSFECTKVLAGGAAIDATCVQCSDVRHPRGQRTGIIGQVRNTATGHNKGKQANGPHFHRSTTTEGVDRK